MNKCFLTPPLYNVYHYLHTFKQYCLTYCSAAWMRDCKLGIGPQKWWWWREASEDSVKWGVYRFEMTGLKNKTQLAEFRFNENWAFIKITNVVYLNITLVSSWSFCINFVYFRKRVERKPVHCNKIRHQSI